VKVRAVSWRGERWQAEAPARCRGTLKICRQDGGGTLKICRQDAGGALCCGGALNED
jgi:hypothetical protein